jgi:mono/diheme cytochrome c family protein
MPACAQGALPPGEGRDLLATACSQCHPLNVIRSMREGADGWKRHVYNMVTRGAQLNAREADKVVAYLAANFGPTTPAASATLVALPGGPGKDLVETRCTACHDLERVAPPSGKNPNGRPSSPTWSAAAPWRRRTRRGRSHPT